LRTSGKERDSESGLDYFEARYYGSALGRFTSPDPVFASADHLTDPQMWNEYAYVRNNPLRLTDPTGLDFYLTCQTSDHAGCGQVTNGGRDIWVQGTSAKNGDFIADRIANTDDGGLTDLAHPGSSVAGTFDQSGVHFNGSSSANGQFIDGSNQTNLSGTGIFGGLEGHFNSDCGGSCFSRGSLSGDFTALGDAWKNGLINQQSGFSTALDLLSGAHANGEQWKDPQNILHIIHDTSGVNAGLTELHYEGHPAGVDVTNFVLHMVDTISDKVSGRAAAERDRALPLP